MKRDPLEVLESVFPADSDVSGEAFIKQSIATFGKWLDVEWVYFASQSGVYTLRCDVFWNNGEFLDACDFDAEGSPANHYLSIGSYGYHISGIIDAFPGDNWLRENNIQSYVAAPATALGDSLQGILVACSSKTIPDSPSLALVMEVLATRFASERMRETFQQILQSEVRKQTQELRLETEKLRQTEGELRFRAQTDPLTGLYNRSHFMFLAQQSLSSCKRNKHDMACLFIDLDHFKEINDTHGHACGDMVLTRVAEEIAQCVRESDILGRLGGEEFAIVLPETDMNGAELLAERIREAVSAGQYSDGLHAIHVTTSIGVAMRDDTIHSLDELLRKADRQLLEAKRLGRDRVSS